MALFSTAGNGGGAEIPTLLWTNPNPNSAYAGGSWINIDISPYNYLIIIVKNTINASLSQYTKKYIIEIKDEPDMIFIGTAYTDTNNGNGNFRYVKIGASGYTNLGVYFSTGISTNQYQTTGNICIPLAIYGLTKNPIDV